MSKLIVTPEIKKITVELENGITITIPGSGVELKQIVHHHYLTMYNGMSLTPASHKYTGSTYVLTSMPSVANSIQEFLKKMDGG